ncbi:MAG: 6-carboxytetrahydropterin synthase [Proteobacteria bacterium]|nr:6-carboxytetrahydropterin synthase [Pseudomonadota bacterium]MCP4919722.1 6-carboxytetrahydropterin synthase [Pseudomonadota bacterium]
MITCTRRLAWDAMHRIPRHESKCAAFHGHRYTADITCVADQLDDRGRVVDFGVIKERVGTWIDTHWDHTAILMEGDPDPGVQAIAASNEAHGRPVYWTASPPTAEVIAAELARVAQELLADTGVTVVRLRVWETPNGWAEWSR